MKHFMDIIDYVGNFLLEIFSSVRQFFKCTFKLSLKIQGAVMFFLFVFVPYEEVRKRNMIPFYSCASKVKCPRKSDDD